MSWVKFELKEEHIAMIKALQWDENIKNIFITEEGYSPFGGDDIIEDLGVIIYGMPENGFDPMSEQYAVYTPEQISHMMTLFDDLPTALELTTQIGSHELGKYKKRFGQKNWSKTK